MTDETMLFRVIEERHMDLNRVTRLAFLPRPNQDNGLLSTYNGDLIEAPGAFEHFGTRSGSQRIGVWGIKVREAAEHGFSSRPDTDEFREHAVIDMAHLTKKNQGRMAEKLRDASKLHGWLHGPFDPVGQA
jgi:hypothetical protein